MSKSPSDQDSPDDIDEQYRLGSHAEGDRPSESVRRAVLSYAAQRAEGQVRRTAPGTSRGWRLPALVSTLVAATLAGILVWPRYQTAPELTAPSAPSAASPLPRIESAPAPTLAASPTPSPAPAPTTAQVASASAEAKMATPRRARLQSTEDDHGADVPTGSNSQDAGARTMLAAAPIARAADSGLRRAATAGDITTLRSLLDQRSNGGRIDVDARDSEGRTALFLAALQGHDEAVASLLAAGADPNAADVLGLTPLQAATANHHAAIAAALRRAGAR